MLSAIRCRSAAERVQIFVLFLLVLLGSVQSICPNSCSGHGQCGLGNACVCYEGWTGGAPDCSFRNCPNATAWVDKAFATDSAHQLAECSNAGLCDRQTGMCKCFEGFTGSACQRSACPNRCSGHGSCASLAEVSLFKGADYDTSTTFQGDGYGSEYLNWDKDSIQLCECEDGFFGPDCSLVMCPKGDDPLTVNQNYRSIRMTLNARRDLAPFIQITFQGTSVTFPVSLGTTAAACAESLSHKGKFGAVACAPLALSATEVQYDLTFLSWPLLPRDNNLFVNDGNPAIGEFRCIVSAGLDTSCEFMDLVADEVREYAYCSGRGQCDFVSGLCACHEGFGGAACANASFLYTSSSSTAPGLALHADALNYTSSVVQLTALRSAGTDFHFIEAVAADERVFFVRGDGVVGMSKLVTLSGGQTISGGGLHVAAGGMTIADGGLTVISDDSEAAALRISSTYAGAIAGNEYSALSVSTVSASSHYLLKGTHRGRTTFSIGSDGAVSIPSAGLTVSQGISVYSGGMALSGGLTVYTSGLQVRSGGLQLTGGLTVSTGGLQVAAGGAQVFGGASVYSGGLRVTGGMTINSGGASLTGGLTISSGGLAVTGGLSVLSGGAAVSGGVTVHSGGLRVSSGGLSVALNGIVVTGGLSVMSGGLVSAAGLTVAAGGMAVLDGLTVQSGGLVVSTQGFTITAGGLVAYSGVTVSSAGATVSGGMTISAGGLMVSGALTVTAALLTASNGIEVTNGLTVHDTGMVVTAETKTDTLSVSGAVTISGQANIQSVYVVNGLTVDGDTLLATDPIIFSDRRLKTNLAPITGALDKVSRLQGLYFNWVADEVSGMRMDRQRHLGVLAQDLLRVVPEVVQQQERQGAGQEQGLGGPAQGRYLSVDYPALIPLLIEAIRDLQAIVNDVKDKQQLRQDHQPLDGVQADLQVLRAESDELLREVRRLQQMVTN